MNNKILAALILVVSLVIGVVVGVVLVRRNQDVRREAAVPDGDAEVSIQPAFGSSEVGDTFPVSVYFNTGGVAVSGIAVRVTYPFSGTAPEVVASNIVTNSLLGSDWNCPITSVEESGGLVNVDVSCINWSTVGFASSTDTLLFTFDMTVESVPTINPVELTFSPSLSMITTKVTGEDTLLTPTSTGSYSISEAAIGGGDNVTATPSATPTATSSPTASSSATPTPLTELPDTGVETPFVVGIGLGVLLLVGATLLAL